MRFYAKELIYKQSKTIFVRRVAVSPNSYRFRVKQYLRSTKSHQARQLFTYHPDQEAIHKMKSSEIEKTAGKAVKKNQSNYTIASKKQEDKW